MPDKNNPEVTSQEVVIRHESYETLYANNVQFFPSEWDLMLMFGELDPQEGKTVMHTGMSIPWLQAKLMMYYLVLHVGLFELTHQKITIPPSLIPAEPEPPSGDLKDDPIAQKVYEFITKQREHFLAQS